jgi:iron complex transport system ATP-binding protein
LLRGWLPQSRSEAFSSTVLETALVGRHPHLARWNWESENDARIARQALAAVGLGELAQRDVQTLSGGERQRLSIATLLAQAPQLYLLDEPLAHLDLNHQIATLELFSALARERGDSLRDGSARARSGSSLLLATHCSCSVTVRRSRVAATT